MDDFVLESYSGTGEDLRSRSLSERTNKARKKRRKRLNMEWDLSSSPTAAEAVCIAEKRLSSGEGCSKAIATLVGAMKEAQAFMEESRRGFECRLTDINKLYLFAATKASVLLVREADELQRKAARTGNAKFVLLEAKMKANIAGKLKQVPFRLKNKSNKAKVMRMLEAAIKDVVFELQTIE